MLRRKFFQVMTIATTGALTPLEAIPATVTPKKIVTYHVRGFSCITCATGLDTMLAKQKGIASSSSPIPKASPPSASTLTKSPKHKSKTSSPASASPSQTNPARRRNPQRNPADDSKRHFSFVNSKSRIRPVEIFMPETFLFASL